MVKVVIDNARGLVQEGGKTGLTVKKSDFNFSNGVGAQRHLRVLEATVNTVNGTTVTDLGVTPPANSRAVGYNVEILSSNLSPAGNITALGFKGGDIDAISGTIAIDADVNSSNPAFADAASNGASGYMPATELMITHLNPGGADKSSEVRVTVIYETIE